MLDDEAALVVRLESTLSRAATAQGVPRSHFQKLTTNRIPTRSIDEMAYWLV
jgi:hypothetical protein